MAAGNDSSELQHYLIAAIVNSGVSREALIRTVNAVYSQRSKLENATCNETTEANEAEQKRIKAENGQNASDGYQGRTSLSAAASDQDVPQPTQDQRSNTEIRRERIVDQMLR